MVFEPESVEFCEGACSSLERMELVRGGERESEVAEGGEVREEVERLEDEACRAAVCEAIGIGHRQGDSVEDGGSVGRGEESGEDSEQG